MKNNHYFIKKISDYSMVGGMGALLMLGATSCGETTPSNASTNDNTFTQAAQKQGAFVVIEKDTQGNYKIINEVPSDKTTIILREDGKERILSQKEIDELVAAEAKKIDEGTSNLTNTNPNGGLSLGETILASAAGAMVGAYIGNKLFNNNNYNQNRRMNYKSPQTYSKSVNSFKKGATPSLAKKSSSTSKGYFKDSSKKSSSTSKSSSFFGG